MSAACLLVVPQGGPDSEGPFSGLVPSMFEVRKHLARKGLTFKVLIVDDAPGHSEPHEFNKRGCQSGLLAPKYVSHAASSSGGLYGHLRLIIHSLCGKDFNTMEENPNQEDSMEIWKDYTTEGTIVVLGQAVGAIKSEMIHSFWGKTMLGMTSEDS